MRNLKRALSLALASVMLLGMMVVGTGASYADVDSADNVEAIEVLQAVNVMSGDDKGNFNPDQVVTRAEMAVIICKMLYGDKLNVSQFAGANVFSDVPAWAQGFVNLAASLDIVAGVGDGKFAPNEPVTTAQATLMLCKALGYFQNPAEFGSDWALSAITKGTQLNLFDDMVLGTNEGLTRNNVAEMTFNALANNVPVDYNETFNIYYNSGRAWTYGVQFRYDDTLGYKNMDLVNQKDEDSFGRPGLTWGIGRYAYDQKGDLFSVVMSEEIITETNDPIAVYTKNMTKSADATQVERDLRGYTLQDAPSTGSSENTTYIVSNGDSQAISNGGDTTIQTNIIDNTANGVTVEVYAGAGDEDSAKIITDIVIIAPEKAEVAAVNTNKGTVTLTGDVTDGNIVVYENDPFYDLASSLSVDDIVAVVVDDNDSNKVLDLYVPETVTGEVTEVNITTQDADKIAEVDGNRYTVSQQCLNTNDFANALGETATIYLDKNGFVLYVDVDAETVPNYMYLTNLWEGSTVEHGNPTTTTYARGVNAEGEIITLEVVNTYASTAKTGAVDATNFPGVNYGTSAGNAYAPTGAKADDGNIEYLTGTTASYGTIVEYKQSTVDPDLYVLVVPETGNTTAAGMNEGVAAAVSSGLSNTAKKIGDAYLSTGVKFVFVNYTRTGAAGATFTSEKLTASAVDGVQTVASGKNFYPVLWENEETGEIRIVTVFVADAFVNDQEVYYVDGDSSYKTQYVDADGKTKTGYRADIYLNGVKMSEDVILTAPATSGFYLLDEMDGAAMKLKGAGTYTTVEDSVAELYNNLLTAGSDSYLLDADTVYVDLTEDYEGVSAGTIKNLIDRDYGVKVSVQYRSEGTDKIATYVYVTEVADLDETGFSLSAEVNSSPITITTTQADGTANASGAVKVYNVVVPSSTAAGAIVKFTVTTDNNHAKVYKEASAGTVAPTTDSEVTTTIDITLSAGANTSKTDTYYVLAADGVTYYQFQISVTGGAAS